MMGKRSTVYHAGLVTEEKWALVSKENKELLEDFIDYLESTNKSDETIKQYKAQLKLFFVYLLDHCDNKFFIDLRKRDLIKFAGWLQNDLKVSPNRVSSLRAVISSLSNYIEKVLDDEYPSFRSITSVIEVGPKENIRAKTILEADQVYTALDNLVKDQKYQLACCLALMFCSGSRKSEVIQFYWDDFTDDKICLNGLAYESHIMRTKGRGKAGKRISRLTFKDPFEKYYKLWMAEREKLGIKEKHLFVRKIDGQWVPVIGSTITSWYTKISEYLGDETNPHALRHAFTRDAKKKGLPSEVIQKIVKWQSADLVEVYSDMDEKEELDQYFAKVNIDENGKMNLPSNDLGNIFR